MIASILQEAGLKTGLYTSPHLRDFRERIRVNGEMIPANYVSDFVVDNRSIIESVKPSFFEMTVAMAFNFFAHSKIDVAVIEVGLGGRLDSTNIITPVLSVITNIGHDHMDLLGDNLEKIAIEKAGIIKPQIPVIISETQNETEKVFINAAGENKSEIFFAESLYSCQLSEMDDPGGSRKYLVSDIHTGKQYMGETVLGGDYQSKNIQVVFAAALFLKKRFNLTDSNVTEGIKKVISNTGLKGRWHVLGTSPLTICDTGHNREGLEYVLNQIKRIPNTGLHMVLGFVNDKDLGSVLPLFPEDATYYFTKASVPRALNEAILKSEASKYGLTGECYSDVNSAYEAAEKGKKF